MKQQLLKQTVLAMGMATLMLRASQAAQIGINFQDDWGGDGGAPVVAPAFGVPPANWFNLARVDNSESKAFATSQTITLPEGGTLLVEWGAQNTYSVYADIPTTGDEQVTYGYLDDTGTGYWVKISGFRNSIASYALTLIAASDSASGFTDALIAYDTDTNTVQYPVPYMPNYTLDGAPNPTGLASTSTTSSLISAHSGNNRVSITGTPKSGSNRSTLAGLLIEYTPGGNNPPEMVTQPQAPGSTVFTGQTLSLSALASGTPSLGYQWRKDGSPLAGATGTAYTRNNATTADSGNYDVVVTNTYGAVTSTVAAVTISAISQPVITQQPLSQTFYVGYPASFTVQAIGGQLGYQWKKGSSLIPDATNATLSLPSITTNDAGTYQVVVSNPVGQTSATATLVVQVPVPGSYEEAVVAKRPAVYFRMSETSLSAQDTAANYGSLASTGTGLYSSSARHPVPGALAGSSDGAAFFDGNVGGRVTVPYSFDLNPSVFSAEGWFQPGLALAASDTKAAFSCGDMGSVRAGWLIYQTGTGWNFRMFDLNGTTPSLNITGGGQAVPGAWYHLAVTFDGTTARLYVNGAEAATGTTASYVPGMAGPLTVGVRADGNFWWTGAADEVALYPTALSAAKILAHYQNGTNASRTTPYQTLVTSDGAVEYLRLNEPAYAARNGGTWGGTWDGTYTDAGGTVGSPTIALAQSGPRPPAIVGFESSNTALSLTNGYVSAPALGLTNNTVTVACWLYREAPESGDGDLSWLAWLGDGGLHMNPDGELRHHWNGGQWSWGSGLRVPTNVWTFVAMVVEPTQATFYMSDGSSLRSSVQTATHGVMAYKTALGFGGNQPGRADRHYRGKLDESAVFTQALTPEEVSLLFVRATGAKLQLQMAPGGVIEDSKPVGTPHHGYNHEASWSAANTDMASPPRTRSGVEQFSAAAASQVSVPADPDFNSSTGTILFWMRANAPIPGPGNEGAMLFDRRAGSGTVLVLNDDGSIFFQAAGGANSFSAGYLPDDTWHHVACVYDQAAGGMVSIYIDGQLLGMSPNASAWSWPTNQPIELGRSHDSYWKRFDGLMDDFRLYNRALSDSEIAQAYATDALVDTTALKLRLNFGTAGIGRSVLWPFGILESSPTLGPSATWTPVTGASSPYPLLPTGPGLFFRARL